MEIIDCVFISFELFVVLHTVKFIMELAFLKDTYLACYRHSSNINVIVVSQDVFFSYQMFGLSG